MSSADELQVWLKVLEQAAERVVITDSGGTILYVNPAFERTTGYSKAEAVGKTPRILKSGKHDQGFYKALWETLLSGRSFKARFVNKKKDGTLYSEEQVITPVKDKTGNITHFLSTATDITEKLELNKSLKDTQKNLRQLYDATWDREERVLELKRRINDLLREMGRPPEYIF